MKHKNYDSKMDNKVKNDEDISVKEHNHQECYEPLTPHQYPTPIKFGFTVCFILLLYSLSYLSFFFTINFHIKKAHKAFTQENYRKAYSYYAKVLKQVPHAKYIKLRMAESLFARANSDEFDMYEPEHQKNIKEYFCNVALSHLEFTIKPAEWKELLCYMPKRYVDHFHDVKGG